MIPAADPTVWDRIWSTTPAPALALVVGTAVLALAAVAVPGAWHRTRHVVTIVHEGGHGVVALVAGRRLAGIRLHSDTSGLTLSRGRPRGPGMVLTGVAGYCGPALTGLGAAYLLTRGHPLGVLWTLLVALALLLLGIRNLFGLWSVLVAGAVLLVLTGWAPAGLQLLAAYVVTWFLLLAAPRTVVEMQGHRRRSRGRTSDADLLARLTHLPALLWVGVFLVVTLGSLVLGGRLLLLAAA